MLLHFEEDDVVFRRDVRAFLRDALPERIRRKIAAGRHMSKDDVVDCQRILNRKGWAVPQWPKEWGGMGWTPIQNYFFREELEEALEGYPDPLPFNVGMVGPVLIRYGTEAQKKRFLPRMANLDDWWCQGFSEPGAGSDLAALQTKGRLEDSNYIVDGQKTWTTYAQHADWMFCLARTDLQAAKRQEGISFLLIDMRSPGVTVRPIITIDGWHEVNEVFFDGVKVPRQNLVGVVNKGWEYAKFLLGHERTGMARVGACKAALRRLKTVASKSFEDGTPVMADPAFRSKVAAFEVQLQALETTVLRFVCAPPMAHGGHHADPSASILKIMGARLRQSITELTLRAAGLNALPYDSDESADPGAGPDWGTIAPAYFNWRKASIYGGSDEIQRNILARAVLGL